MLTVSKDRPLLTTITGSLPVRQDGDKTFNENVIVEFYSR